ncbi:hypothetical protein PFMALIP_01055 [Plasmodium falciparum MaliPS096_E11]|uniref:Uncharacterized protein n=1 Tax=Plasmodium falciparum MaliPS096_E11 TaxID=1036727 RepID=A0A024WUQ4_PLAFA|nr:hypothetical protein PFMALIP_01055 [Plasmodium falciparum MaliPS096_E11]
MTEEVNRYIYKQNSYKFNKRYNIFFFQTTINIIIKKKKSSKMENIKGKLNIYGGKQYCYIKIKSHIKFLVIVELYQKDYKNVVIILNIIYNIFLFYL